MEDGDTELDIVQPVVYLVTPKRCRSRWRPMLRRHALRPLHRYIEDEAAEPAWTPPADDFVKQASATTPTRSSTSCSPSSTSSHRDAVQDGNPEPAITHLH